jgi:recombination protein RecA
MGLETLQQLVDARIAAPLSAPSFATARFDFEQLCGRLIELSSHASSGILTAAVGLVLASQRDGAPAAWIAPRDRLFFPPDLIDNGVDLAALAVVRVTSADQAIRSADRLLRSGAFGAVVIDLGRELTQLALPAQSRLASLAQKHRSIVVCLTDKSATTDSLGSLISLRGEARRVGRACELTMLKDKRHGPGWSFREECRGPAGLR